MFLLGARMCSSMCVCVCSILFLCSMNVLMHRRTLFHINQKFSFTTYDNRDTILFIHSISRYWSSCTTETEPICHNTETKTRTHTLKHIHESTCTTICNAHARDSIEVKIYRRNHIAKHVSADVGLVKMGYANGK